MPRLGRLPLARPVPATFARGLMFVAVILLHGPASAREPQGRGKRRPVDSAAARARQLYQQIRWEQGPATADLGAVAELRLARGFAFTGKDGAKLYLEMGQNLVPENLLGILAPLESSGWFVVFEYRPRGPEDDPNRKPDADALLRALRQEDERQNATRRSRGWAERKDTEWEIPPSYEGSRRDLTWATRFDLVGRRRIDHTTRIFGRHEVIDAHLMVDPKDLARVVPTVTNFLTVLEFKDVLREGGTRPGEDEVANRSSSSGSSSYTYTTGVAYRPSSAVGASSRGFNRMITGGVTGVTGAAGAAGAAMRKKRRSS